MSGRALVGRQTGLCLCPPPSGSVPCCGVSPPPVPSAWFSCSDEEGSSFWGDGSGSSDEDEAAGRARMFGGGVSFPGRGPQGADEQQGESEGDVSDQDEEEEEEGGG